ncbi:RICIN domain-containing protein [Kitasatospora sp. NPDC059973]|uniref:RICIN domain-containing protein n=1 Tax=Kitasatospora sp. NPDC059973 TaxID=3347020 RepID=UPI003681442B
MAGVQLHHAVGPGGELALPADVSSGLCADVAGGSTADGARVVQLPAGDTNSQEWKLEAV